MRTKHIIISILLVLTIVLVVAVGSAMAKKQCKTCKNDLVLICHKPGEHQQNLCVAQAKVPGHIGHGDYLGCCRALPPVTEPPDQTEEPPINTEEPPVETQEPPIETIEPSGAGSDNDIAAVTWMSTHVYHNADKVIVIKWVGDAGHFRLCKKVLFGNMPCWNNLPVPEDAVAVSLSEMRGTFVLGDNYEPGIYFLYAHHWRSGNTGNDNTKINKFEIKK